MSDAYASVLQYFNVAITCVFAIEAIMKLTGFGFYVSSYAQNSTRPVTSRHDTTLYIAHAFLNWKKSCALGSMARHARHERDTRDTCMQQLRHERWCCAHSLAANSSANVLYERFYYCSGSCVTLKSLLFCYRRKKSYGRGSE